MEEQVDRLVKQTWGICYLNSFLHYVEANVFQKDARMYLSHNDS